MLHCLTDPSSQLTIKSARVPSASIEVNKISPAPRLCFPRPLDHRRRYSLRPRSQKPPLLPPGPRNLRRLASMATITAWAPKLLPSRHQVRIGIATRVDTHLIAPASKQRSLIRRADPPAHSERDEQLLRRPAHPCPAESPAFGVAGCRAKQSNSAPAAAWRRANSAGSPASTRSTNAPLHHRPLRTSRQAIIRLVSMETPENLQDPEPRALDFSG